MQDRFAHGLARNGSGIYAHPSQALALLNERDFLSGFGSLNSGALAGRPRADDNKIKFQHDFTIGPPLMCSLNHAWISTVLRLQNRAHPTFNAVIRAFGRSALQ